VDFTNATSKVPLLQVPYVDRPSIQVSSAESVEMPFKYVKGKDGKAIMPEVSRIIGNIRFNVDANYSKGMIDLLGDDADKGILDLL
jgi:ribosome biogenesis SPOUT family RNA methylase Rps3